jgi:hypothetical protein
MNPLVHYYCLDKESQIRFCEKVPYVKAHDKKALFPLLLVDFVYHVN